MRSWLLIPLFFGCTGSTETGDSSDASDTVPTDTGTPNPDLASIEGTLVDADGAPIAEAKVNLCRQICRTDITDAAGRFSLIGEAGTHSVHVEAGESRPEPLFPLSFEARASLDLDLKVPTLGAAVPLPSEAGEIEVIPGELWLTTAAGSPAVPLSPDPVTSVAAARFAAEDLPIAGLPGTLLGGFHLAPYQAKETAGTPVRIANTYGLAAGASVEVFVANYTSYAWVSAGTLTADAEAAYLTGAAKLPEWTTLALVQPAP